MTTKMIEIRDVGTTIAALAMCTRSEDEIEKRFLWRAGYAPTNGDGVILMNLSDHKATSDPYEWYSLRMGTRTMQNAHRYIIDHWEELKSGDVVDVQFILGETKAPKRAEIGTRYPSEQESDREMDRR